VSSWPSYTTTVIFTRRYYAVNKSGNTNRQDFEAKSEVEDIPQ